MKQIIQMDSTALITFAYERDMENGNIFHDYTIWREIYASHSKCAGSGNGKSNAMPKKKKDSSKQTHTHTLASFRNGCCCVLHITFCEKHFHGTRQSTCWSHYSVCSKLIMYASNIAFTKTRRTQSAQGMCYSNSITKCCTGRRAFISHLYMCIRSYVCKIPNEEIRPAHTARGQERQWMVRWMMVVVVLIISKTDMEFGTTRLLNFHKMQNTTWYCTWAYKESLITSMTTTEQNERKKWWKPWCDWMVRYPRISNSSNCNAQPLAKNDSFGLA